jgi:ribonuclease P protein component
MLPKQHRLLRSRDFARVRRRGRSASGPLFALYVLPVRTPDVRVGFSVSKKVGKAVVRNRVKRRFREAVKRELPSVRPGCDLVFIARPAAAGASYWEIVEAVQSALHRTGAIVREPAEASHA